MNNSPAEIIRLARQTGVRFGEHSFIVVQVTDGVQYAEVSFPAGEYPDNAKAAAQDDCGRRLRQRPASSFYVLEVGAPAPATPLTDIIADMLAYQAEQFDGTDETDLNVSGADLVDAFTQWRIQLREAMAAMAPCPASYDETSRTIYDENRLPIARDVGPADAAMILAALTPSPFSPPPIGLLEIADDLSAAVGSLQFQLDQVCQLHNRYTDESVVAAHDEGDEAVKRLELYRKADPKAVVYVSRSENDLNIWSPEPLPGLQIVTLNWDIDDLKNYEVGDVTMVRYEPTDDFQPCLVGEHVLTGVGRTPETRPATEEDMA